MHAHRHANGFTLLEVLIALVVFAFGMLGLAALLAVSVRVNNGSYLRTQAGFLAQSMADRMRANGIGLWGNAYNATYTGNQPAVAVTPACANSGTTPATCSAAQIAQRDGVVFANQLGAFLPNQPTATITCTPLAGATVPDSVQVLASPPYSGTCDITITWGELALDQNQNGGTAQPQSFDWVFQP